MLLNGTWRQHKTLTSNTAHTGHTRALDTKCDSQVIHGDLNHTVCFQVGIGGGDDQGRWLYVTDHRW